MTRPQVPALMVLALDYYRQPLAYRHLSEVRRPLPDGFDALLTDFCAALSLTRLEETAQQLEVEPVELEAAARFLVRHVLLNPAGDYYRHLGLNRDASAEAIKHHYQLLIRQFHPDRVDASTEAGAFYATRINLAYRTLRQVDERARYDAGLTPYPDGVTDTDAAWFFRPNRQEHPAAPAVEHASGRRSMRSRPRVGAWIVVGLGVVAIIVSLGFVLSRSSQLPTLRLASTARGDGSAPLPHYLAGGSTVEQGTAPGGASKVPAQAAAQVPDRVQVAVDAEPPPDPPLVVALAEPLSDVPETREQAKREQAKREQAERERAARDQAERELAERQRTEREQAERERVERELADRQQAERQRAAPDQTERERFERELAEAERQRVERERAELLRAERLKAEREKAEREQAERQQAERELAARQEAAREKAEREKAEREQAERQRAAREQAERQRVERERAHQREQAQREKAESAAAALMSRLESAYRMENATAFAALFTADAQVNEGSGRALIRRRYADLFARSEASELSINTMRWQLMRNGRLKGTGRISVRNRYVGSRNWQRVNGRVDLELVSFGSGYRIARMIDYLN